MRAISNPRSHKENAFSRHISEYHRGDEDEIKFKVDIVKGFKKAFERQIWEGVEIHGAKVDILMNSKLDYYQPAVGRMCVTNQVREDR